MANMLYSCIKYIPEIAQPVARHRLCKYFCTKHCGIQTITLRFYTSKLIDYLVNNTKERFQALADAELKMDVLYS